MNRLPMNKRSQRLCNQLYVELRRFDGLALTSVVLEQITAACRDFARRNARFPLLVPLALPGGAVQLIPADYQDDEIMLQVVQIGKTRRDLTEAQIVAAFKAAFPAWAARCGEVV